MPLDTINRLMEAAEVLARDITKRLERIEGKLDDITKDPEIKGFYYCDPPKSSPSLEGLFTYKAEAIKDPVAVRTPPCFNCSPKSCLGCDDINDCPIASNPDDHHMGVCDRCILADKCFV